MSEVCTVIRLADWADRRPFEPGMVVLADVRNPIENPDCLGKVRPAVLVERQEGHWLLMGLTSRPFYRTTGLPRVPVPNWARVGLRGPGFIWGDRLTHVCALDIHRQIGWADPQLVMAICDLAHLSQQRRRVLMAAALLHHPAPWRPYPGIAAAA